jgi:hypothetical protein
MSAEKRSISGPDYLFAMADKRCEELHYNKFSDYIQELIQADIAGRQPHQGRLSSVQQLREAAGRYGVNIRNTANSSQVSEAAKASAGDAESLADQESQRKQKAAAPSGGKRGPKRDA